ncbi:hypothetical protein [Chitinimonas sp.]|uniref:hypothetical protein n=1 Tax=Chitinimonas sp. TaxID=1934313 RepID=UPI0035AE8283
MTTMIQADAWVLGSYRKLDALDVPAFHGNGLAAAQAPRRHSRAARLLPLTTRWPQQLQRFADFVAGKPATGLSTDSALQIVLRYCASPLRHEPLNSYRLHRAVASTRSFFPLQLQLLVRGEDGQLRRYRYLSEHHALEEVALAAPAPELPANCNMAIIGVGRYWLMAGKYAEFTPFAVTLEAGMVQAQLDHLTRMVGWQTEPLTISDGRWHQALGLADMESLGVAIGIRLATPWQPPVASHSAMVADWQPASGIAQRFGRLAQLAALFDPAANRSPGTRHPAPPAAPAPVEPAQLKLGAAGEREVLTVLAERSSGNDAVGFAPIAPPSDRAAFEQLMAVWQALSQQRQRLPGEEALTVSVAWLNPAGEPIGLYDLQGQPLHGQADPRAFVRQLEASLPHQLFRFNMAALSYVFLIGADIPAATARHGDFALRRLHLAAGAVAQDISLALTAFGMFARPVRMLKEMDLASSWNLADYPVYQLLAGFNRSANWAMELM